MKIKYLGTAAAEGVPAIFCDCETCRKSRELGGKNIRSRSQALVDDKLLIDFPADTYMHFILHNVPMSKIKSCIITHAHSDHLYEEDIGLRKVGYSHIENMEPMTFYADTSSHQKISEAIGRYNIEPNEVLNEKIFVFKTFEADGYKITPIRAAHQVESSPVVYIIEKDGKTLFYGNDTSDFPAESWEYLETYKGKFDLVSLDCTAGNNEHVGYVGHMNIKRCNKMREKFRELGLVDDKTIYVLTHFTHNAKDVVYDDFVGIAKEQGYLTAYDGMEIEF